MQNFVRNGVGRVGLKEKKRCRKCKRIKDCTLLPKGNWKCEISAELGKGVVKY